jgi:riboflavin synthase
MFTGLVEETGRIRKIARRRASLARLTVEARKTLEDVKVGDSIAVAGVCLTVVEVGRSTFTVEVSGQTLTRTTMGRIRPGEEVNLERAVGAGDRLGGHIVLGHVDCVGTVRSRRRTPRGEIFEIAVPPEIADHFVERGSVAVDGTSLTIVSATRRTFSVAIIPHTLAGTTLSTLRSGERVNVEVDVLARYAALERQRPLQ